MFPFTTCISILRRNECPENWKQINGTMTFLMEPRHQHERRGDLTFNRRNKNAICIQMLEDVTKSNSPAKLATGQYSHIAEADRKMLDKLTLPEGRPRLRSRFMSVSKGRRQRKSLSKYSLEVRLSLDECYHSPSNLLLLRVGNWDFNIFSLENISGGRPLFHVAYHLFQTYDFIRSFQLDSVRLIHFLSLIEQNYHDSNPYHNAIHAADVTQSMHSFLQEREIYESTSDLEKMAALVAALTHDLDHPGVNNTFLIVTSNLLATLYQNISVLENHHWRSAVGLIQETGLLSHLSTDHRERFIQLVKAMILATDITRQQEFLLKFSRYIDSGEFQYRRNEEHRHFMLQIALKCSDISNPCRPWKISQQWSRRICQEFFLQGDTERTLNVAVTPLCDRYGNTVANIQNGFIMFVVTPLFKVWDKFIETELSAQMMSHLHYNQSKWKSIMDSGKACAGDSDIWDDMFEDDKLENIDNVQKTDFKDKIIEVITDNDIDVPQRTDKIDRKYAQIGHDEEEGKSEEDDIVENDVNLLYHYQTESEESGRCLSPVSEDSEQGVVSTGNIRRYSAPYVVRKDLNFYLGLRKDLNFIPSHMFRRQSLPTTVMYFHGSSSGSPSPRSLSMDALMSRPKISNLSTSMEMNYMSSGFDHQSFTPLKTQILMLQGGSLTRFISSSNFRRASLDPILNERQRISNRPNLNSDLVIPPFKNYRSSLQKPVSGLANSWPTVARRSTTNGSTQHSIAASGSSTRSISSKSISEYVPDDHLAISSVSNHSEINQEDANSSSSTSTKLSDDKQTI